MSVHVVADVIREDAKNEILDHFFSPEYLDDAVTYDITQNRLLEHGVHWQDALRLWDERDFTINENALAEYIAQQAPKAKARAAIDMCPNPDLLAEYLFDENKIDWYSRQAWAMTRGGWILVTAEDGGLHIVIDAKDDGQEKRMLVKKSKCSIVDMQVDGDKMLLEVECNGNKELLEITTEGFRHVGHDSVRR